VDDIHLRTFGDDLRHVVNDRWEYLTYCGIYVHSPHVTYPYMIEGPRATCMGCILVNFQNLAEESERG
jgi:hypothetical protein